MSIASYIKSNAGVKKFAHWLLIPSNQARPRWWVRTFLNRFYHTHSKGSVIRSNCRLDLFPFNPFSLGEDATIETFCTINNGVGAVTIGNRSLIGIGNTIIGPVTVGNDVIFAQNIVASGLNHVYTDVTKPIHSQGTTTAEIIVEQNCWIGANVVLTAGVTIGRNSVIAGGAVVTKSIPPYSVAVGNPARVIKQYNFETKEWESVK